MYAELWTQGAILEKHKPYSVAKGVSISTDHPETGLEKPTIFHCPQIISTHLQLQLEQETSACHSFSFLLSLLLL
jgi:hypothetical protein